MSSTSKAAPPATASETGIPAGSRPIAPAPVRPVVPPASSQPEHGGPAGLEPTRYGDWERKGRCIDF